jgi:hypothetical protein
VVSCELTQPQAAPGAADSRAIADAKVVRQYKNIRGDECEDQSDTT